MVLLHKYIRKSIKIYLQNSIFCSALKVHVSNVNYSVGCVLLTLNIRINYIPFSLWGRCFFPWWWTPIAAFGGGSLIQWLKHLYVWCLHKHALGLKMVLAHHSGRQSSWHSCRGGGHTLGLQRLLHWCRAVIAAFGLQILTRHSHLCLAMARAVLVIEYAQDFRILRSSNSRRWYFSMFVNRMLPEQERHGRRASSHAAVINGLLWLQVLEWHRIIALEILINIAWSYSLQLLGQTVFSSSLVTP